MMNKLDEEVPELALKILESLKPILDGEKTSNVIPCLCAVLLDIFVHSSQMIKKPLKIKSLISLIFYLFQKALFIINGKNKND
jgi:hypothetical protein